MGVKRIGAKGAVVLTMIVLLAAGLTVLVVASSAHQARAVEQLKQTLCEGPAPPPQGYDCSR